MTAVAQAARIDTNVERMRPHATSLQAPPAPHALPDTGLAPEQIEQLIVKMLFGGESTGQVLADRTCLPYSILEAIVERLRVEKLLEVRGASGTGSVTYRYALTDLGRDRAKQYLEVNHYIGPAPVPLAAYVDATKALAASRGNIDQRRLRQGFSQLIVADPILERLGPAINAGKAVFLYGPPGNGKTVLGEGMGRSIGGDMYVPHALDVDGQIVTFFDPINHERVETDAEAGSVIAGPQFDRRWIRIRRPVAIVGGELTLDMLDLTFNPLSKLHEAPIQLKANGGVFLVDDFGRQRIRPQDLLNRWIVPLESRVDYLTLNTGRKFQVPFDVLIVFATNLDPASLADEAFLRRIPYKVAVGDPTAEEFSQIFELNCRRRGLHFHQVMVTYLLQRHYEPLHRPMRACHPRDLIEQVDALCRYRGIAPTITRELLDRACETYFVDETVKPS
ncbi:MAG TPA: hypothetical protein VEU08_09895 [Vicinamibacterales bacterium]|nr:hypothetical protein [Vicinamibacterales bacterium]